MSDSESKLSHTRYIAQQIEPKWQDYWLKNKTFKVEVDKTKPKYYVLDMFPYPSGAGLHVGHPEGYTATDILARYKRMLGFNVLHPMGWDAFGLPAEQYALETGTHPAVTTEKNINTFRRQIQSLGFSYDWDREISTCNADYYKWTQWIFMQLYKKGLAYMDDVAVNWCPALGTVLANEEVIDGKSERGGHPVYKKPMRQWVLKITDYAERLLADVDALDWPEGIKEMQRNWIGKSEGINFKQKIKDFDFDFEVYDSIPQTFLAQTFTVIAPEHPIIPALVKGTKQEKEVLEFVEYIKQKKLTKKFDFEKDLEGIFTGRYVENPFGTGDLPLWIASYVLVDYGTGIVNCSSHDERDFAFAKKYNIPLKNALLPEDPELAEQVKKFEVFYREPNGILQSPEECKGLKWHEARGPVIDYILKKGLGRKKVNYKLRDWLFSRQRYWGEPFPIIHTEEGTKLIPESQLPLILPSVEKYQPTEDGQPTLARATDWVKTTDSETGKPAMRETNTMPQWAGSCWYYLRFIDPKNINAPWDKEKENYWMPVDLYVGGAEHAVLHLLYSRFWHKVLYDIGVVSTSEPFQKLVNQGMILGEDNQKMSKSRGNVINPDVIVKEYGADTLRMYEMFMGPLEQVKPWNTKSVGGIYRFLNRVWNLFIADGEELKSTFVDKDRTLPAFSELNKLTHRTIQKVTSDLDQMKFHTAIAALMTYLNEVVELPEIPKKIAEDFILLLAPFAPHLCEELWEKLGHKKTLAYESWPKFQAELTKIDVVEIAIQINGKLRDTIEADAEISNEALIELTKSSEKVKAHLQGKTIIKEIVVPKRLVNFVVK
ncbi:MAG: leucine--tRNA ligase [Proteobacteria bacterium]|nr:leucine--tRNA ligase [Pseudomonadota bacterium]